MAPPGEFKGQRRSSCGHVMAAFDCHDKCSPCPEKKVGQDPCVKGKVCNICDGFSEVQRDTLATPSYKIRKEKKRHLCMHLPRLLPQPLNQFRL